MRVYIQFRYVTLVSAGLILLACQQSEQAGHVVDKAGDKNVVATNAATQVQPFDAQLTDSLGDQWKGRDGLRWNVTAVRVPGSNEYVMLRRDRTGSDKQKGNFTVEVFGKQKDKLKIIKRVGDDTYRCDGLVSSDRRFISGVCFTTVGDGSVVLRDHAWWVTIKGKVGSGATEASSQTQTEKLNINLATVEELEQRLSLDPEQARSVIDYKLGAGSIKSLEDLQRAGVLPANLVASLADQVVMQ